MIVCGGGRARELRVQACPGATCTSGGGSEASPHPWQGLGDAAQEGPLGDGFRLLSSGPVV